MTARTIVAVQPWPWGLLVVEQDRGGLIDAHRSAAFRLRLRRIRPGDRVDLQEVVPGRGRIVRRLGSPSDALMETLSRFAYTLCFVVMCVSFLGIVLRRTTEAKSIREVGRSRFACFGVWAIWLRHIPALCLPGAAMLAVLLHLRYGYAGLVPR